MATTREVRYTTSGTYDWQPSSISTSAVETTSPHYWTGVPTSLQTDWTTTSSTRRTSTLPGLGNWSSGPSPIVYQSTSGSGDDPYEGVPYYPTTYVLTSTFTPLTSSDILTAHSTGIPATQSYAKITSTPMNNRITYSESVGGNSIDFQRTGRFQYKYRKTPQYHRALTVVDETRTGGGTSTSDIGITASQGLNLFIVGSDCTKAVTGTTTNDFALSASTDDFAGGTFSATYQATGTYDTQGGNFSAAVVLQNDYYWNGNVTVTRKWEGNTYNFNSSDGDHTIPTLASTSTLSCLGGIKREGASTPSSTLTITESSVLKRFGEANLTTTFTQPNTTPKLILGPSSTLSVNATLVASIANLVFSSASISCAFTTAATATWKPGVEADFSLDSTFTTSFACNTKYDVTGDYTWNSLSNNPFVESGYVKGGYTADAEYEWDDLITSGVDDTWDTWTYGTWLGDETNWDDWPNDAWTSPLNLSSTFTQADTIPTYKLIGASTPSIAFTITEDVALNKAAAATLTTAFSCSGTSSGIIDITQTITASFTLTVSDIDYVENILEAELPINVAFTTSFTGSIKYASSDVEIASALTFTLITGDVKYDIEDTPASTFTTSFTSNIKYDISLTITALASKVVVGRLYVTADPYNTATVPVETRTIVIPTEQRQYTINKETRLNNIVAETRLFNVKEETRKYKLPIASMTNRYTVPKTRSK